MNKSRSAAKFVFVFLISILIAPSVHAFEIPSPVVDTNWLASNLGNVIVLDVRSDLSSYVTEGHISGAVLVNWKKVRASRKVDGLSLIKLVPLPEDFEDLMQKSGVYNDSAVVITSHGETFDDVTFCTRLYWTMKYYGFDNMAILDGGNAQWEKDGNPIDYSTILPAYGNFAVTDQRDEILATTDDVLEAMDDDNFELIDVRDLNFYLGMVRKSSYVYADGHISGSKHFAPNLLISYKAPTVFMDTEKLVDALQAIGINPDKQAIGVCNSGHQASGVWFLINEILGKDAKLYDGSLHEWTMRGLETVSMEVEEMEED